MVNETADGRLVFPLPDNGWPHETRRFIWIGPRCNGGNLCADVCPTGAIKLVRHRELIKNERYECSTACPVGIDVARYMRFLAAGKFPEAVAVIREKMPFPAVCGYVCQKPCEIACLRGQTDEPILIRELKRAAAEHDNGLWKKALKISPPSSKRVAVVGSGPAGLTTAYYLALKGHRVTVFEAMDKSGGKMMNSIREWHLPKDVLMAEIRAIQDLGVEIITDQRIEEPEQLMEQGWDSVIVAAGLHHHPKLPPVQSLVTVTGDDFLKNAGKAVIVKPGARIVILGGGRTAFECALAAHKLGAAAVHLLAIEYRSEGESNTWQSEQAVRCGAMLHSWRTFPRVIVQNGRPVGAEYYKIRAFGFSREGNLELDEVPGSACFIPADVVIDAINTGADNQVGERRCGVFIAGDAVSELRSVIEAIAAGRWAASAADRFLGGDGDIDQQLAPAETGLGLISKPVLGRQPEIITNLMPGGYAQVELTLSSDEVIKEAGRCLSCDLCYPVVRFDLDVNACIKCGRCLEVCYKKALVADISFDKAGVG